MWAFKDVRGRALTLVALLLFGGCGLTHLVPAETAQATVPGSDAVFAEEAGVRVIAQANAWPGTTRLPKDVIGIALQIDNASGGAIYGRHEDIALEAEGQGPTLWAIDPEAVFERKLVTTVGVPPTRLRGEEGGGYPPFGYPHGEPPTSIPAQTEALPVGPIADRGSVRGYVYFPKPFGLSRCDLVVTIRGAPRGPALASLRIPFRVRT